MSFPAIAWAMKWSRKLKLPTAERMLLVALADSLNIKTGRCDPGQEALADNTGLTSRHIRDLMPNLTGHGLVKIVKRGRALGYQLCMDGVPRYRAPIPEPSSANKQELASAVTPEPSSGNGHDDTGTWSHRYRNPVPKIPEPSSDKPYLEPGREPNRGGTCESTAEPSRARRPLISLPPEWKPNGQSKAKAINLGLSPGEIDLTADQMRAWAKAGDHRKADWDAMFDRFVLQEFSYRAAERRRARQPSASAEIRAAVGTLLTVQLDEEEELPGSSKALLQ